MKVLEYKIKIFVLVNIIITKTIENLINTKQIFPGYNVSL